ncbi:LLM class flavin-dependent oxidoreductase [Streptomyces sp. AC563]|uniref:LLM class flavin-dependent oxidoreductase n=1 Tax=Streptomyces buecherae TaxID=2763006 RepID=UPI00164EC066|nr:LLM class flavin-dependent oxidoreductase [Streptomyces buecherae]MBC3992962.1 LLM class flavin-dependent oxidoreductase [Streptomyces buecherae]
MSAALPTGPPTAPSTAVRFNLVDPTATPESLSRRYRAAIDMAAFADDRGIGTIQTEEHHGAVNGWLPSPLTFAGTVFGATRQISVTVAALLAPLYDPLRLAEDIAVLDLLSGGRLVTVAGLGSRRAEYGAHGKDWRWRGKLQDEALETLLAAWTGEPFGYRGRTVRVTPRPYTQPHPPLYVGGGSRPAARRAARLGLPMFLNAHLPRLAAYYRARCAEYGTAGRCVMPAPRTPVLHLSEDPDRTWATYGQHLLHEARVHASWQAPPARSGAHPPVSDVDALRRQGRYRVVTPDECVELAGSLGDGGRLVLHPLCGGIPVEEGWSSLHLFASAVLPKIGAAPAP